MFDWDKAPHWAKWVAKDDNDIWYWYEHKPTADNDIEGWSSPTGKFKVVDYNDEDWFNTLEARP